jgi:hypothetical protein
MIRAFFSNLKIKKIKENEEKKVKIQCEKSIILTKFHPLKNVWLIF